LCLLLVSAVGCSRQAAATVKQGSTLPVYLPPAAFTEANQPGVEIAVFGASYFKPGPERLYGYALRDLRDYLQKMTGAQFPLTALDANAKSGVFAGTFAQFPNFKPQQANSQKAMASTDPEAFVIEAQGDRLFILGKSDLGLMAGIYSFLDRLGCKWFAPGTEWENVPQLNGLVLDSKLNLASAGPSYKARFYFSTYGPNTKMDQPGERDRLYLLWSLRNRMGGSDYTVNHHNAPIIDAELFKTRPELFALSKEGKRIYYELARGKPEAVALAKEVMLKYLKDNEGKGSYFDAFSAEPNDGAPADEESLALIGNHTPTDLAFWFANQLAATLEEKGMKQRIGILSYSDHAETPSFDLHPKVAVMVATDLAFTKMTVEQRLNGFRQRKATSLGIYDYLNLIIWSWDRPGASPAGRPMEAATNLKRWYELGARTYVGESADSWISGGAGQYLYSRLMWNIQSDPKQELDAYYQGAFGPAAGEIRALYESWAKRPAMTRGNLAQWHQLITTAEERVKGNPLYQARLNQVKRYYLYLNFWRELNINLQDPRVPAKAKRWNRLLGYVASQRGEDSLHAVGLFLNLVAWTGQPALPEVSMAELDEPIKTLAVDNYDKAAWAKYPAISDEQINTMFAAVRLPLNGQAVGQGVLDPAVKLLPAAAKPPAEIKFPPFHNAGEGHPLQYTLQVVAPTPKLTLDILASRAGGGGTPERTVIVADESDKELKKLELKLDQPASIELTNVQPGIYTVTFPEFGAHQLTVRGGNTFGAARAYNDVWGYNPLSFAGQKEARAYFVVPAGRTSLKVGLAGGTVALGFHNGDIITPEIVGSAELKKQPQEFKFAASDKPRIAVVEWGIGNLSSLG